MKSFRLLALTAAVLLSFAVAAVAAPVCSKKVNSFDFVVDYSGSMMMKNDKMKQDKIEVAKIAPEARQRRHPRPGLQGRPAHHRS